MLSTLHTSSAAGAIPRLIDMRVEPFLLVSTLHVVVAQRLVRELCSAKEKYFLTEREVESLSVRVDLERVLGALKQEHVVGPKATWKTIPFYKPQKSVECEDGYKGRKAILEVLNVTPTIKDIVLKGGSSDEIEAQAKKEGMMTMIEDGIFKAASGVTSLEEVLRVVSE